MDVSGTWLGTYWQDDMPTRFEVTFVQSNNALSGSILDDCYLGEAQLSGDLTGRRIHFVKHYLTSSPIPIAYTGTLDEEGNFMSGTWKIDRRYSGNWEAHRSNNDLMADLKNRLSQQIPVGATS